MIFQKIGVISGGYRSSGNLLESPGIKCPRINCLVIKCPFLGWGSKVWGSNVHFDVGDQKSGDQMSGDQMSILGSGIKRPRDQTSSGSIFNPLYGIKIPKSKVWGSKVRGSNVHHPFRLTYIVMMKNKPKSNYQKLKNCLKKNKGNKKFELN